MTALRPLEPWPPMEVMLEAAIRVHGFEAVLEARDHDYIAKQLGEPVRLPRLVIAWEWPDPNPFPRFRLWRHK